MAGILMLLRFATAPLVYGMSPFRFFALPQVRVCRLNSHCLLGR